MTRYQKCLWFATLFNSHFRYDIVHDAWLYYLEKTGEDLFKIPLKDESSYLYTIVKRSFYRWYYHERTSRVTFYPEGFEPYSDGNLVEDLQKKDLLAHHKVMFMSKQVKNPKLAEQVFDLLTQGYDQVSTAEKLKITKQAVYHYSKQLKK
jgi:hypothetical protein